MLRINIDQQNAKLALSITDPAISLRRKPAKLEMHTEAAVLEIRQSPGTMVIDQSPCRASYGLKTITQFTGDFAQKGMQAAFEAIGEIAEEGERLARIESGENAIVAIAVENSTDEPVEVVLKSIPRPYIHYYPQPVEYNYRAGQLNVQYQRGDVDLQLNRGVVDITMVQYPSIRMWTTGSVDFSV